MARGRSSGRRRRARREPRTGRAPGRGRPARSPRGPGALRARRARPWLPARARSAQGGRAAAGAARRGPRRRRRRARRRPGPPAPGPARRPGAAAARGRSPSARHGSAATRPAPRRGTSARRRRRRGHRRPLAARRRERGRDARAAQPAAVAAPARRRGRRQEAPPHTQRDARRRAIRPRGDGERAVWSRAGPRRTTEPAVPRLHRSPVLRSCRRVMATGIRATAVVGPTVLLLAVGCGGSKTAAPVERHLVYVRGEGVPSPSVWIADVQGGHARRLARGYLGVLSPDGRTIAVARREGIFLVSSDGRSERRLTARKVRPQRWTPDGKALLATVESQRAVTSSSRSTATPAACGRSRGARSTGSTSRRRATSSSTHALRSRPSKGSAATSSTSTWPSSTAATPDG